MAGEIGWWICHVRRFYAQSMGKKISENAKSIEKINSESTKINQL